MWTYEELSLWRLPSQTVSNRTYAWPATRLGWRETADAYYVEGKLPEFRKKDLTIEAHGQELEVRAERERGLWRPERRALREVFTLPEGADPNAIDARFDDGELSIRIAKLPFARRRTIPLRVNGRLPPAIIETTASTLAPTSWLHTQYERLVTALRTFGRRTRSLFGGPKAR